MSSVDIIVPCYNYGRYLRQCARSVLSQEGVDVRVLIIDDCSPDHTPEVAAQLLKEDPRVQYRRHAVNQGHIATYDEGLEWCAGDYVVLISPDDALAPGALDRATHLLDHHGEVGMAYGRDIVFRDDETLPSVGSFPKVATWQVVPYEQFLENSCALGDTGIQAPTVVVRTSLHKKVGGYRKELPHTADTEIWLRLAAHGSVGILDADQAFRRLHHRNMSLDFSEARRLEEQQIAFDIHFREYGQLIPQLGRLREVLLRTLSERAFWCGVRAFERGDGAQCKECLDYSSRAFPAIRTHRSWRRFRWKRMVSPRVYSFLSRLFGKKAAALI